MRDNMKTIAYNNEQITGMVLEIIRQITLDGFKPDYIVGITRGGLVPALMISHFLNIPMHTLRVSLRDGTADCEVNCWMSEDAYGLISPSELEGGRGSLSNSSARKNILIVDDINDTGATVEWIKNDWQSSCMPNSSAWEEVWNGNVKFATLVNNEASNFKDIDYHAVTINKLQEPSWVDFPWENWWK
jgi:hypoxanthine phosphoribosyltransferase